MDHFQSYAASYAAAGHGALTQEQYYAMYYQQQAQPQTQSLPPRTATAVESSAYAKAYYSSASAASGIPPGLTPDQIAAYKEAQQLAWMQYNESAKSMIRNPFTEPPKPQPESAPAKKKVIFDPVKAKRDAAAAAAAGAASQQPQQPPVARKIPPPPPPPLKSSIATDTSANSEPNPSTVVDSIPSTANPDPTPSIASLPVQPPPAPTPPTDTPTPTNKLVLVLNPSTTTRLSHPTTLSPSALTLASYDSRIEAEERAVALFLADQQAILDRVAKAMQLRKEQGDQRVRALREAREVARRKVEEGGLSGEGGDARGSPTVVDDAPAPQRVAEPLFPMMEDDATPVTSPKVVKRSVGGRDTAPTLFIPPPPSPPPPTESRSSSRRHESRRKRDRSTSRDRPHRRRSHRDSSSTRSQDGYRNDDVNSRLEGGYSREMEPSYQQRRRTSNSSSTSPTRHTHRRDSLTPSFAPLPPPPPPHTFSPPPAHHQSLPSRRLSSREQTHEEEAGEADADAAYFSQLRSSGYTSLLATYRERNGVVVEDEGRGGYDEERRGGARREEGWQHRLSLSQTREYEEGNGYRRFAGRRSLLDQNAGGVLGREDEEELRLARRREWG
ncbi:hypothetical protein HDU98_006607 [Podochytrium sp. JEL0797]|nr:hypothetical protein HDU98_006607 [Podochytrium sp. JEL0797]